jgi:quinol monooxygenase YgiN
MSQTLLTVFAEIVAKPGKEEEVRRHVVGFVEPTRKEEGCVQYDLHFANDEPGRFLFYETWESEAHLQKHSESPHIQAFRAVAGDITAAPTRIVKATRIA